MSAVLPESSEMEQSQSLLLNEQAFRQCPDPHKNVFLYEWLKFLDRILPLTKKEDMKDCQQRLLEQLSARISSGCAQPSRVLLGRCIARLFAVADTSHLFQTINTCNDVLKDPTVQSHVKLTALSVLGEMYERLGRMVGRSYEETFHALSKWMKSAESGARVEILNTMAQMVRGLGSTAFPYKELYKSLTKALTDRVMPVRAAAAKCLAALVAIPDSPLFANHDLESVCTLCIKALHSSNFEVRQAIARVFAAMAVYANSAHQQSPKEGAVNPKQSASASPLDVLLHSMAQGMLRGGVGGFLKTAKTATGIQAGGQRETRVGLAEAYVAVATALGPSWLKRNIPLWTRHLLELATAKSAIPPHSSSASADDHPDALALRRCLHFILRSTIGALLSEPDQITACRQLGAYLADYINCFDCAMDSSKEEERVLGADVQTSAQASVVCLMEIGCLALQLDTAVTPVFIEASGVLEPVFSCLLHPVQFVRIAAAWCLKCTISAIPSMATPLIDRCLSRLEYLKKSPEAISGFSLALAAILAQSRHSPLGIPFAKCRQVFTAAEDLVKSATQVPRLMLRRVQAGWLLISAVVSLGPAFAKPLLPRLLTLWRISFPRSAEETKTERGCGDANTWEATLESRAGALGSMAIFVDSCPELVNDELSKRLIIPIETSLSTLAMVSDLLLMHGIRIRPAVQLLHLRLFSFLCSLSVDRFESAVNSLLTELVSRITLMADNPQTGQRTSLCAECCFLLEDTFLGGWIGTSGQAYLELELNPLQTRMAGSLDNDPLDLVRLQSGHEAGNSRGWWWPEPQPLPVAALDSAVQLFSRLFPVVSTRRKLQLLHHFGEQLKSCKPGIRLQSLHLNILCSLLLSAKSIGERRTGRLDDEQLQQASANLVLPSMASDSILLKCLAVETLGRLAQAVGTPKFVAGNAQHCFDKIRIMKDESSRQGYALALGVFHRRTGSLASGQHLNTTIGILLALAQDVNCSAVKPWAMFALSLIASTGSGMFCPYAEPVRNLCLQLLLNNPQLQTDVVRAIAKLVFALISSVGPELSTTIGTIEPTRNTFLVACSILAQFEDPVVKADAIACYQHFHLFAPRFVELGRLVVTLCGLLKSSELILRKSALAFLRQLLQQETKEVREHLRPLIPTGLVEERELSKKADREGIFLPETGLEGVLFEMLDTETDCEVRQHIKQSLLSLLQATSDELLGFWLLLCKDKLASSQLGQENIRSTLCVNLGEAKDADQEGTNDEDILQAGGEERAREKLSPRWPSRVFAFELVQRLLSLCDTERAHLDLALAKELQMGTEEGGTGVDFLVLHLSDLVRMGFMGATSENINLCIAGLNCLQNIITRFAKVAEPEFPGHVLLEQFQAQIGAALRPAFSPETPGNLTALACQVASTWICSGVARDLNDLRRVHQLLASSLAKLTQNSASAQLYNESVSTQEKLAILRAWAKVYICAIEQRRARTENGINGGGRLLELVEPELDTLVDYWFAALHDFGLLSLPAEFVDQWAEKGGGTFFGMDSAESCKEHYRFSWPMILLACSVWIRQRAEETPEAGANRPPSLSRDRERRLYLMLGTCLDSLCSNRQYSSDDRPTQLCINSLKNLLECEWAQLELMEDVRVPVELLNVLYKMVLTRDSMQTQKLCIELLAAVLEAAKRKMAIEIRKNELDMQNGNEESRSDGWDEGEDDGKKPFVGAEGQDGVFQSGRSLVFASLEVLMCVLVRQMPEINTAQQAKTRVVTPLHLRKNGRLSAESDELIHSALELLAQLSSFCCPQGNIVLLPSMLNLLLGVIRECSRAMACLPSAELAKAQSMPKALNTAIIVLRKVCSVCPDPERESKMFDTWESLMRSALLSLLNLAQKSQQSASSQSPTALFSAVVLFLSAASASPSDPDCAPESSPSPSSPPSHARICIGEDLFHQFCCVLRQSIHSQCAQNRLKAVQSVRLLFQCRSVSGPFVRELGNDIFSKIRPFMAAEDEREGSEAREPSEEEAQLIMEVVQTVGTVLTAAKGDRERLFVSLLVRTLVQLLRSSPSEWPAHLAELHEFSLVQLNTIGVQHPESFKALLQAAPEVRERIERATQQRTVRQKEEQSKSAHSAKGGQRTMTAAAAVINAQPTIKLAMDFSAFAAAKEEMAP